MYCWTLHLKGEPNVTISASVAIGYKVYYLQGSNKDRVPVKVHIFNTVSLSWISLPPVTTGREVPYVHHGFSAVLIEDTIYIWGRNSQGRSSSVLYAFNVDAQRWFKPRVSGTGPKVCGGYSACGLGKVIFIYGGSNYPIECSNDMYKLDTSSMVWSLVNVRGTQPHSYGHSATIIGTKMFVFGGRRHQLDYNNIRVFDTEANYWLNTPSAQFHPKARERHSAFTYNGELYIFGGYGNYNQKDLLHLEFYDLWKFNPLTLSWTELEPKGNGPYCICSCTLVRDRVILFGRDPYFILHQSMLDLCPTLKTLCKLAVVQYGVEPSGLPHNVRWELAAETKQRADFESGSETSESD